MLSRHVLINEDMFWVLLGYFISSVRTSQNVLTQIEMVITSLGDTILRDHHCECSPLLTKCYAKHDSTSIQTSTQNRICGWVLRELGWRKKCESAEESRQARLEEHFPKWMESGLGLRSTSWDFQFFSLEFLHPLSSLLPTVPVF
jgi:hypothetical protein